MVRQLQHALNWHTKISTLFFALLIKGITMRIVTLFAIAMFANTTVIADDADDAGAKLHEYFDKFNEKAISYIVTNVYSTPVHIGGGTSHSMMADPEGAAESLESLYEQIEAQGWAESRISDLKICMASDTLALVDTRYSRLTAEGEAIPPAIRTTLYIVQKIEGAWKIVSFYSHDNDVRPGCE